MTLRASITLASIGHVWDPIFPAGPGAPTSLPDHVFFLWAPGSLPSPQRHDHSQLRRAVRRADGMWQPDIEPVLAGSLTGFDQAIWGAGLLSLSPQDHFLLYTGRNMSNPAQPYTQRIGLAQSTDSELRIWERHSQPVIVPDLPYSSYDGDDERGAGPIFRDPYPFLGLDGRVHVAFAARLANASTPYNACIGHAVASNPELTEWELLPPLVDGTNMFGEMEVPQVVQMRDRWYIFFTVHRAHYDPRWAESIGGALNGLHCFTKVDLEDTAATPCNNRAGSVWNETYIRGPRLFGLPVGYTFRAQGWRDGEGTTRGFDGGLSPMLRITLGTYRVIVDRR